jgi:protein-tyrosine phosphatase
MSNFIASKFGSKKGCLRYLCYGARDLLLREYVRYGKIPKGTTRVVFVCKGNICRSAAAEVFFKKYSDLPCVSVGLETTSGNAANNRVMEIVKGFDVSLSAHRTTAINDFNVLPGDLYVCMEPENILQLERRYGKMNNISLLGKFGSPQRVYIHDPYNANIQYANNCIKFIYDAVKELSLKVENES